MLYGNVLVNSNRIESAQFVENFLPKFTESELCL